MAKQNKVVNVLSTAALAGLVTSAMLTSQAFAKVDAYTVKVGEDVFKYDKAELVASYLDNDEGLDAPLYKNFVAKVSEGKGVYAFHDDANGFVSFASVADAFAAAEGQDFDMNAFTESDKAEVVTVSTVKKAVVVDGEVKYNEEGEVTGDLAVKSVESINAAQIKVTFNKALTEEEKDEATDLDNYTLNNSKDDEIEKILKDVDAEEGSKEVILTVDPTKMDDDDDDYQNQASFKLVINENVTGEEVTKELKVSDFDIPEVESVEVAGIRTIKVSLTEPVVAKDGSDLEDAFEVNGGDYSIDTVESINNGKELNIILFSDLKDGEELKVEVKSEAEDFAGYSLKKGTFNVEASFDNSDLAITEYKKAKDTEITLVFNKDIKFADFEEDTKLISDSVDDVEKRVKDEDDEYHGYKVVEADSETIEGLYHTSSKNKVEAAEIDGNELTLYFASDEQLPETAYVYVDADVLEDLWDEKNDDLFTKVNINKDNVKPEIKTVEQDDDSNRKIVITFNEDMEKESAEDKDNYTVEDKDGKAVRVSDAQLTDDNEVTLTLSKDLENGDKYKVTIEDVEDVAGNKVEDTTKEFTAKETQAVDDATARFYEAGESDQKIVVDFDREMLADGSRYAVDNLENYDLKVDGVTINLSDYDGASIKSVDNKTKVEIKLPGNDPDTFGADAESFDFSKGYTLDLTINKVDDANENRSDIDTILNLQGAGTVTLDDTEKSPATTDLETITVVFEDELDFEKDDVMIGTYVGTTKPGDDIYTTAKDGKTIIVDTTKFSVITPSSTKIEKNNGVTKVTYMLKADDQLAFDGKHDGKDVYVVTAKATESENNFGDKLVADSVWKVMDEIAPELAKLEEVDGKATTGVAMDIELDDRDDYDDAVKVTESTVTKDGNGNVTDVVATVELTFEEDLTGDSISKYVFDTDDSDVKVTAADLVGGNVIRLTLTITDDETAADYDEIEDFLGLGITSGSNEIFDLATGSENGVNGAVIDTEIEIVDGVVTVK